MEETSSSNVRNFRVQKYKKNALFIKFFNCYVK